jgi:hypothetical protein
MEPDKGADPRVAEPHSFAAIFVLIVGFCLIAGALASPELPILGKYYNTNHMHTSWPLPPEFHFYDSTSPGGYSKTDKGQGGYYDYPLEDEDGGYKYQTTVCFQSDKRISMVCYFYMNRHFTPDEVDYLLGVTSGTSFKEMPLDYNFHCVAGLWKLYVSPDGRVEATVGYDLESGKLEPFCVEVRFSNLKPSSVASCGGWIE